MTSPMNIHSTNVLRGLQSYHMVMVPGRILDTDGHCRLRHWPRRFVRDLPDNTPLEYAMEAKKSRGHCRRLHSQDPHRHSIAIRSRLSLPIMHCSERGIHIPTSGDHTLARTLPHQTTIRELRGLQSFVRDLPDNTTCWTIFLCLVLCIFKSNQPEHSWPWVAAVEILHFYHYRYH